MKEIYRLIRIAPKIESYCDKTDIALERTALDVRRETTALAEEMERLIELKRRLVNLSVICRGLSGYLTEQEMSIVKEGADGATLTETGKKLGISCSSAARMLGRLKNKCSRYLDSCGIDGYADLLARLK